MKKETRFQALIRSELVINTSILISGTVLAQLIPILLRLVLSRGFFTPEMWGAYSVYISLIGMLVIISSFKYELAIILPRKDNVAANVLFLALLLNLLFNLLLFLVIILFKSSIIKFLNLSIEYGDYLYFVPLGTFLYSTYQSINFWLVRKKKFIPISINKFVRRGFEGASQITFKFAKIPFGLIYGDLIGNFANICSGIYQGTKSGLSLRLFSPGMIKKVIIKYSEYPKYNVVPSFMSACSFLLPAILVNKYYNSEYAGYLDFSKMLLSIPLALVATSLSSVLLQRVSEMYRNNQSIKKELISVFLLVLSIAIAEILLISLFGVSIFKVIFGDKWEYSGVISKILVWSYALNFCAATFSFIFISMNRIKTLSAWQLFYFASILSLFFFKNLVFNDFLKVFVLIDVICSVVSLILMAVIIFRYEEKVSILNNIKNS